VWNYSRFNNGNISNYCYFYCTLYGGKRRFMVEPNDKLRKFHLQYCAENPIDSIIVIIRLLEEIKKIKNLKRRR